MLSPCPAGRRGEGRQRPLGRRGRDGPGRDHAARLEGVDVVYYLVHSLGSSDFDEIDRRAATTVAAAAEDAGVSQIVFLGGLGDDAPDLSPHLRSRAETAAVLVAGAVPVTILRAAVVVGQGSAGFETIVSLVDRLPVMIAPRWVKTPTQPIALADVVGYLAGVAGRSDTLDESFDVGGPEVLTYREMIERVGRLRGRSPRIVEVPVLSPRLSSYWLHLVTPVRAGVARPLVEGLRNPTVARDERIRALLPRRPDPFRRRGQRGAGGMTAQRGGHSVSKSPVWYARTTAWTRSRSPSFWRTCVTWVFTVVSLMKSSCPISAFDRPRATSRRTSRSRALRSSSSLGGVGRGRRMNRSITRFVTVGERSASPAATV